MEWTEKIKCAIPISDKLVNNEINVDKVLSITYLEDNHIIMIVQNPALVYISDKNDLVILIDGKTNTEISKMNLDDIDNSASDNNKSVSDNNE